MLQEPYVQKNSLFEPSYNDDENIDYESVLNAGFRVDCWLDCPDEPDKTLLEAYDQIPI